MLNIFNNNKIQSLMLLLMVVTFFFFLFSFFFNISIFFGVLLLLIIYIFLISFYYPLFGISSFLLLRPLLDFSTDYHLFSLAGLNINLASLMGGMVIFLGLYYFLLNYKKLNYKKIKRNNILYFWILFILINLLSLFISFDVGLGFREILRLLSIFSLFILAKIFIQNNKDLTKILKVVIVSAILPSLIGLWQYLYKADIIFNFDGRLAATFAHPNMLAFFIFFAFSVSLFVFLYGKKNNVLSYIYLLSSILFFIIIVLTYTRTSWLALLFFITMIGVFKFKRLLVFSMIVLLLMYSFISPLQNRVNDTFDFQNYDSSVVWRLNLYKDSWSIAKKKPIFGHGADTASTLIENNRSYRLGSPEPHNDYMKIFLDTGIIGLVSYFLLIISTGRFLYKKYQKESLKKIKALSFFVFSSFLAISIISLGDNVLNDTALQWSMWFVIGAMSKIE